MENNRRFKKHNAVTDGFIPKSPRQVLPDKLLNALLYMYEKHGAEFSLTIYELCKLLDLSTDGKTYGRIKKAIEILQQPLEIRDFSYKGKKIKWMRAVFISAAYQREGEDERIHFKIEDMFVEACKQKYAGYTNLVLDHTNKFVSKYGLKLYEMYKRYESMPSGEEECGNCVVIKRDLDYLNHIFSTNHKYPSKLISMGGESSVLPPINKGLQEIKEKFGIDIHCFYHKPEKVFVFTWIKPDRYPKLKIPLSRIHEFLTWYIGARHDKIEDIGKYYKRLYMDLLNGTFNNLEVNYRNFLILKYGLRGSEIDALYDTETGKFKDFKNE